jgi:hypothetical protein
MKDYNEKMSKNIYNLFSCLKVWTNEELNPPLRI